MDNAGVVGNDCRFLIRLMGISGEESHFALIGIEDHFLGGAPFIDSGDRTL